MIDYLNLLVELIILGIVIYIVKKELPVFKAEPIKTERNLKAYAKSNGKRVPIVHTDEDLYDREVQANNRNK